MGRSAVDPNIQREYGQWNEEISGVASPHVDTGGSASSPEATSNQAFEAGQATAFLDEIIRDSDTRYITPLADSSLEQLIATRSSFWHFNAALRKIRSEVADGDSALSQRVVSASEKFKNQDGAESDPIDLVFSLIEETLEDTTKTFNKEEDGGRIKSYLRARFADDLGVAEDDITADSSPRSPSDAIEPTQSATDRLKVRDRVKVAIGNTITWLFDKEKGKGNRRKVYAALGAAAAVGYLAYRGVDAAGGGAEVSDAAASGEVDTGMGADAVSEAESEVASPNPDQFLSSEEREFALADNSSVESTTDSASETTADTQETANTTEESAEEVIDPNEPVYEAFNYEIVPGSETGATYIMDAMFGGQMEPEQLHAMYLDAVNELGSQGVADLFKNATALDVPVDQWGTVTSFSEGPSGLTAEGVEYFTKMAEGKDFIEPAAGDVADAAQGAADATDAAAGAEASGTEISEISLTDEQISSMIDQMEEQLPDAQNEFFVTGDPDNPDGLAYINLEGGLLEQDSADAFDLVLDQELNNITDEQKKALAQKVRQEGKSGWVFSLDELRALGITPEELANANI